jgi:putative membrane-bound dehydrogenase-like protein
MNKQNILGISVALLTTLLSVLTVSCKTEKEKTEEARDSTFSHLIQTDKDKLTNAVAGLNVMEGLEVCIFASEPALTNPTDIDIDHRGRVWALESYNYRNHHNGNPSRAEGDRIIILEDTNGDGKADTTKVFYEGPEIASPLGIFVMGNRAIVSQSPHVWLFTDTNGDDKADKKEIIFSGIGGEQSDHGMHTFVAGPDGKYYFNFGNLGSQLLDGKGKAILDEEGGPINEKKYKGGLVFRCNRDFKNVEVLAQNFRNNYEVSVDSYGTMWQSDNDDDGNESCRVNYVMEKGNYGFTDELTNESWEINRTNIETEIPRRHWHQNDPGVVPNLLITGGGSPTGIMVYEGSLLPQMFHSQVIHSDAWNVVRLYSTQKKGGGYEATSSNVIDGSRNQWFRPSDVCTAPDGSVMIADWYGPVVGGNNNGDLYLGRVFNLRPPNHKYKNPKYDFSTVSGAIVALQSPNISARALAFEKLNNVGIGAEKDLSSLYQKTSSPTTKARTLWLLSKLANGKIYIEKALRDDNPDIRTTAVRALRQVSKNDISLLINNAKVGVSDVDAQVRRECAITLRKNTSKDAPVAWATLAAQHNGKDRWYLEALGIGADGQWDAYFGALLKKNPTILDTDYGQDLVWRSRSGLSVPFLATLAGDNSKDLKDRLRYFRAFDFNLAATAKSNALLSILKTSDDANLTALCLHHLDAEFVKKSAIAQKYLHQLLDAKYGTDEYIEIVKRYQPLTEYKRLLALALKPDTDKKTAKYATKELVREKDATEIWATINGADTAKAKSIIMLLKDVGNKSSFEILEKVILSKTYPLNLTVAAATALGGTMDGEDVSLKLLLQKKITNDKVRIAAATAISNSSRKPIRDKAGIYMERADPSAPRVWPTIGEMAKVNGNVNNGRIIYFGYCMACHQTVDAVGVNFGPKLATIGDKLGKEAILNAIIHPNAGVSYGYEGYIVKLKDGSTAMGIMASKSSKEIVLKIMGGTTQNYKMSEVSSITQMQESLMPTGLHEAMTIKELTDLVQYLSELKKK